MFLTKKNDLAFICCILFLFFILLILFFYFQFSYLVKHIFIELPAQITSPPLL